MSGTFSHVLLAGIVLNILLGTSTTWSTVLVITIAAVTLEHLRTVYKHYVEISAATLMSLGLAISLIVANKSENGNSVNLDQYLLGSIITINMRQVTVLSTIVIVVVLLVILFIRPMYILTFDEETAFVDGLSVRLMSIFSNIVTGIAAVLTILAAGALLVSMIMALPTSVAIRSGKNFKSVILIGVAVGLTGVVAGIIASYYWEAPASTTTTVIFVGIFLLANLFNMIFHRNS